MSLTSTHRVLRDTLGWVSPGLRGLVYSYEISVNNMTAQSRKEEGEMVPKGPTKSGIKRKEH